MEKKMVKQFSLTKLMIALAITLQFSAVFADKDFDALHNMYESSDCSSNMGCSLILQALLANAIDNPRKHINKENDVINDVINDIINKINSQLDKHQFRDEEEEENYKNSRKNAISLFKEMSIKKNLFKVKNKKNDAIYHLLLHIHKKINETTTVIQEMIEKYE